MPRRAPGRCVMQRTCLCQAVPSCLLETHPQSKVCTPSCLQALERRLSAAHADDPELDLGWD